MGDSMGGCNAHRPGGIITMTKFHIIPFAMAISIALTCVSFAQGTMAPQGSNMSNTTTSSGSMAKPDAMSKTDGMKKDEMSKDGMKKGDMSKDGMMKKDGMSK